MLKTKPKIYKLTVQIGKIKKKDKMFVFSKNTKKGLIKALLSIDIPKMMEEVTFTLEKDGKASTRDMNSLQARRIFNNKLNAFYLIKTMHWVFK
mgnify:CR=1 FL=1